MGRKMLNNKRRVIRFITIFAGILACNISAFATPKRIVSLAPSATEILYAIGAGNQVVARTDFCNYPPEAMDKPSIGGFATSAISVEIILSYEPDFVYGTTGMHEFIGQQLQEFGIEVYLSEVDSIDSVIEEIIYIGEITGHKSQAKKVASSISNTCKNISSKIKKASAMPVPVYYEVWSMPFMSVGTGSFIADVITTAGGTNIFGDITDNPYPVVSEEEIIVRNPSVILIPQENYETIETISSRHGWQEIDAVRTKRVNFLDSDIVSRPGPRIDQALLLIAKTLYPDIDF